MFDTLTASLNTMQAQANDCQTQLADAKSTFSTSFASLQLLVTEELNAKASFACRSR